MKERELRNIVNAYSRQTHNHPFEDFGNNIRILVNDDCPVQECLVQTQYEDRNKEEQQRPYKGWNIAPLKFRSLDDVDAWDFRLKIPEDFIDKKTFIEVEGSARVRTCDSCNGQGRNTCYSCHGKGKELCQSCHGDYEHLTCPQCGGSGRDSCSNCHGTGKIRCEKCNGTGYYETYESEWVTHYDYSLKRDVGGYEYVKKRRSCSACGGRGTWDCRSCNGRGTQTCYKCHGSGDITCPDCTKGYIICNTCSGKGYLICSTCAGEGKNEFRYIVNRTLSQDTRRAYVCDKRVREFAEEESLQYPEVQFETRQKALEGELFSQDVRCCSALSKLVSRSEPDSGIILFQEAKVQKVTVTYLEYSLDGSQYAGYICNGKFYSKGQSPIDEWSSELVDKAEKKIKRGSSAKSIKMLEQARDAGADSGIINSLLEKARKKLGNLYDAGVSVGTWLSILFLSPVVFNYFLKLNPVLSWAIVSNNPAWNYYGMVPLTQTLIYLAAILLVRGALCSKADSAGEKNYASVWAYFVKGLLESLGLSLVAMVIVMILNYIGLGVITTFIVGLAVVVIATVLAFAYMIVEWIIGIFK